MFMLLFLDSVYVERYLGLPASNQLVYNQSNALNKAYFLKNKKLLLVFGTADGKKLIYFC